MSSFDDYLMSVECFIFGLMRHWYFTLITLVADPFGLLEIFGYKPSVSHGAWPYLLLLACFVAATKTYHELRMEKVSFEEKVRNLTSKKLELVFGQGMPFEQMDTVMDSHGKPGFQRLYRVGVKNVGGMRIDHVRVQLEHIDPFTVLPLPLPLRIMHDRPSNGDWTQEFSLNKGSTVDVDMVAKQEWKSVSAHPIFIQHTVSGLDAVLPPNRQSVLTILAHGEGAEPCHATFTVTVDDENRLIFLPVLTKR